MPKPSHLPLLEQETKSKSWGHFQICAAEKPRRCCIILNYDNDLGDGKRAGEASYYLLRSQVMMNLGSAACADIEKGQTLTSSFLFSQQVSNQRDVFFLLGQPRCPFSWLEHSRWFVNI